MFRNLPMLLAASLALTATAGLLRAVGGAPDREPSAVEREAAAIREFIKAASMSGAAEVGLARIARPRSSDTHIRAFADEIERDGTRAGQELGRLAALKGMQALPEIDVRAWTADASTTLSELSLLSGTAFDRAWMAEVASECRRSIDVFTDAAKSADADVRGYAVKRLPALHAQLARTEKLYK